MVDKIKCDHARTSGNTHQVNSSSTEFFSTKPFSFLLLADEPASKNEKEVKTKSYFIYATRPKLVKTEVVLLCRCYGLMTVDGHVCCY